MENKDLTIDQIPIKHLWIGEIDLLQYDDIKILGQNVPNTDLMHNKKIDFENQTSGQSIENDEDYRWGFKILTAVDTPHNWDKFAHETFLKEDVVNSVYPIVEFNDGIKVKSIVMGYSEQPLCFSIITIPTKS